MFAKGIQSRWTGTRLWTIAAAGVALMIGCVDPNSNAARPTPQQVVDMPLERRIVRVAAYYPPYDPWIWSDDRSRVRGMVISATYLEGPNVLGVFGDGIIRPRLFVLDRAPGQTDATPRLVKEWSFDPDQALPFRAKKRTMMGWGYGFRLIWDEDLDLSGKSIMMIVAFERRDGIIIQSDKGKEYRVPKRGT